MNSPTPAPEPTPPSLAKASELRWLALAGTGAATLVTASNADAALTSIDHTNVAPSYTEFGSVPEPSSLALGASGVLLRRRRKAAKTA